MGLPDDHQEILDDYLTDGETVRGKYADNNESYVVTDERVLTISTVENNKSVDSVNISGEHVVGSKVKTSRENEEVVTFGLGIIAVGIIGWSLGLPGLIAGIAGLVGIAIILLGGDESTKIEIVTKQSNTQIQIPEDAEHLGQQVSKVIAGGE
ncbi:hypothetical protein [Natranaeroarchaeum sulfidigenes]|uniref:Uncharacterized protein n=1 Tax=Natranaeroarchaeum sulfidigenes TaxID=2784880 RepID=A0A897MP11_9EURY|nr:hypothetical protein [Natranaeroarchaeum sulfidigenes]QSG02297.1 hypothetical protein AArcS_1076 [Natranaeroarchaeum sulfidigenes]